MKDLQKGLTISILVHSLILCAVYAIWTDKSTSHKTITLDFSIVNFETQRDSRVGALNGESHAMHSIAGKRGKGLEGQSLERNQREATGPVTNSQSLFETSPVGTSGILSDREGLVETYGKEGSIMKTESPGMGDTSFTSTGKGSGGGQDRNNEGQTIRYGSGSINEKTFHYIRDGILKNVRYPEIARRKGMEGRILLSFIVMENGTTHDVKVISGSGFRDLDKSAQEAIRKTTFSQKIPYKLFVTLPIEFRLE